LQIKTLLPLLISSQDCIPIDIVELRNPTVSVLRKYIRSKNPMQVAISHLTIPCLMPLPTALIMIQFNVESGKLNSGIKPTKPGTSMESNRS